MAKGVFVDFGNTPATKLTERIMGQLAEHIRIDPPPQENHHYNRVYEIVHREVLAYSLVDRLARKLAASPDQE